MKSFTLQGIFVLFFRDWWRTREWPAFWWGLPAFVLGSGLVLLFSFAQLTSPRERSHRYLLAARQAFVLEKLETAEIFYKKALLERPDDVEALLEAAVVADQLDDATRRDAILKRLVDEDAYPSGMLLQASVALSDGGGTPQAVTEATELLQRALAKVDEETRESGDYSTRLDDLYRQLALAQLNLGQMEEAIGHWEKVAEPTWEDRTDLALANLWAGEEEASAAIAQELRQNLPDGSDAPGLLRIALVLALNGEEARTRSALYLARRLMTAESEAMDWANTVVRSFQILCLVSDRLPLGLLEQAMAISPVLPSLANECVRLAGLMDVAGAEPPSEEALLAEIALGRTPVIGHVLAGLLAANRSDDAGRELHWELAQQLYPGAGLLASQCAVQLAQRRPEDGDLPLALGELSVRLTQGHPGAKLRYGNVLMLQERWEEAIELLEPLESETATEEAVAPLLEIARDQLAVSQGA